ncbi:hypothetical protein [Pseudoalteromonas ostreae]|uniref:hypothetical protein n=1 Tax=Pseudoalteromonas ostreae TaxID=2774154 RepID=UPI001B392280|nr:hypothetical protein [Pseudoalteromonas ostreae]
MGNNKFKLTKLALALGLTATLSGCFSDNDNNDYVKPPVKPEPTVKVPIPDTPTALSFYVAGNVVDSVSGEVVASTVKFLEAGVASTNVTALNGDEITEVSADDGFFTFTLAEGAELTSLTALVTAEGYASNSVIIDLSDKSEVVDTIVSLVKLDEAKVTILKKENIAAADGKLATPLDETAGAASIKIGSDIELQDAAGAAVTGTEITLNVVTADINATADKTPAVDLIPEGLSNADAAKVVVPAAYMTVEMFAGDTKVKNFSGDISLAANLPNTFKTIDGSTVAAGDKFDVSSYNEETGVWTNETEKATVGTAGALTLPANFATDHLTGFALSEGQTACTTPIAYTFTGDAVPASGLYVHLNSSTISKKKLVKKNQGNLYGSGVVANNAVANVSVRDKNGNVWATVANANLCGTVNVELNSPVDIVSQNLNVTYTCSNAEVDQNKAFPFTGAVVLYSQTKRAISTAVETAGSYALTGLQSGSSYDVKVIPTGVNVGLQSTTVTANGTDVTFNIPRDNCTVEDRVVTGTTGTTGTTGGS